jgi:hypothetical protein
VASPAKSALAVLLAAGLLAIGVRIWWRRPPPAPSPAPLPAPLPVAEDSPQGVVFAMLDAARRGDAAAWLSFYTGSMRATLDSSVRKSAAAIKGIAVSEPEVLGPAKCRVHVEYVYADRNETQNLYLEKSGAGWRIARADPAERIQPAASAR